MEESVSSQHSTMYSVELFIMVALYAVGVLGSYHHEPTANPIVLKSGYLADTHEVAAAKGAHLAALAKESHYGHGSDYSGSYGSDYSGDYGYGGELGHGYDVKYHGPTAIPHVLKNGHIADTHEVAAAKAEHYAAVSKAKAHGGYGYAGDYGYNGDYGYGGSYGYSQGGLTESYGGDYKHGNDIKYHGPTAIPHVLKNGHIADTHEVAAAKAEHYAAVSKAKAHSGHGYAGDYGYGHSGSFGYSQGSLLGSHDGAYDHGYDVEYHGPIAIPHVLKNGHIADTHEVVAAKAEHHAAVNQAKSHGAHGHGYSHDYKPYY